MPSPAKLNLNLLVGAVRQDGFHPVDSVVSKVTLYDMVRLTPQADGVVSLMCDVDVGPMEKNLAYRAAVLLKETTGSARGVAINLQKHIPAGGGFGGASSNAATVLRGLSELWELGLSASALADLGATLGSDVPLFLGPPAARMTGRGETLTLLALTDFYAVLFITGLHCSTPAVYGAFDAMPQPAGEQPEEALWATSPADWHRKLTNHLQAPAFAVCPELKGIFDSLKAATGSPWQVTGSGSGLFVLAESQQTAEVIARKIPVDLPGRTLIVRSNPW